MLYYHPVFNHACVAQLAEQLTRNEQVAGSNPATSSIKSYRYRCVWRKARRINRFRTFLKPDFFF